MLATRILSGMLVLTLLSQGAVLAQESQPAAATHLDLSSTSPILPAGTLITEDQSVHISQGGSQLSIGAGDLLTPGQFVAVSQALAGGQTLHLDVSGAAVGGSFNVSNVSPQLASAIANLVVPQGVTAIHDFGTSALSLTGNFTNSGVFYAVSSSAAANTAQISALNISNGPGALLTTVLPAGGLAGYTNLLPSLNLSLTAVQNIVNYGTISSSGSLSATAGGSISNLLPQTGLSSAIQAANDVFLQASSIINQGNIASQVGALNLVTANLQNQSLIESVMASLSVSSLDLSSGALNVLNQEGVLRSAGALSIEAGNELDITGGIISADGIRLTANHGMLEVLNTDLQGSVHVTAESAHLHGTGEQLNLASFNVSVDPLITNTGDLNIVGNIVANEPITIITKGNITGDGSTQIINSGGSGDIYLIAGVDFLTSGASTTVSGSSNQGGNISGIASLSSNGAITIAAFQGAVSLDRGAISVGNISSKSNVLVVGPGNISTGNISTNGGNARISTIQPGIIGPLRFATFNGARQSGDIFAPPNSAGTAVNLTVGEIDTRDYGGPGLPAGDITLFSRGGILANRISAASAGGAGGDITARAETLSLTALDIDSSSLFGGGNAGQILLEARGNVLVSDVFAKGDSGGAITAASSNGSVSTGSINSSGSAGPAGAIRVSVGPGGSFNLANIDQITASGSFIGNTVIIESPNGILNLNTFVNIGSGTRQLLLRSPAGINVNSFIDAGAADVDYRSPIITFANGADTLNAGNLTLNAGSATDLIVRAAGAAVNLQGTNVVIFNSPGRNIRFEKTAGGQAVLGMNTAQGFVSAINGNVIVNPDVKISSSGDLQVTASGPSASINNSGIIDAATRLEIGTRNLIVNDQSMLKGGSVSIDGQLVNLAVDIIGEGGGSSTIQANAGNILIRPGLTFNLNFKSSDGTGTGIEFAAPGGYVLLGNNLSMGSIIVDPNVALNSNNATIEVVTPVLQMGSGSSLRAPFMYLHGGSGGGALPVPVFEIRSGSGIAPRIESFTGSLNITGDPGQAVRFSSLGAAAPATLKLSSPNSSIFVSAFSRDVVVDPHVTLNLQPFLASGITADGATIRLNGAITTGKELSLGARTLSFGPGSSVASGQLFVSGSPAAPLSIIVPTGSLANVTTTSGNSNFIAAPGQMLVMNTSAGGTGTVNFRVPAGNKTRLKGDGVDIRPGVQLTSNGIVEVESHDSALNMNGSIQAADKIVLKTAFLNSPDVIINGNLSTNDLIVSSSGDIMHPGGTITAGSADLSAFSTNIGLLNQPIRLPGNIILSSNAAANTFVQVNGATTLSQNSAASFRLISSGPVTNSNAFSASDAYISTPSFTNNSVFAATNTLRIENVGDLNVSSAANLSTGRLTLASSQGAVNANLGSSSVGTLTGSSAGSFQVSAQDINADNISAGTDLTLNASGQLALSGVNNAGGVIRLNSAGSMTIAGPGVRNTADSLFFTSGDDLDIAGINTARDGQISLAAQTLLNVDQGTELIAAGDVNLSGQSVSIGRFGGSIVKISAGRLDPALNQLSTDVSEFDYSSILVPGAVSIRSNFGNIDIQDNVRVLSNGESITMFSTGGINIGSLNRFFAQGGNITLNATGQTLFGDINIGTGTSLTAVARLIIPSAPFVTIPEGLVINDFVGGNIGINVDQAIPNYNQFLRDNFDVNRTLAGQNNTTSPGPGVYISGSTITQVLGGTIDVVATDIAGVSITASNLNANGGVIQIDPPFSNVNLNGVTLSANGPDLQGGYIPPPDNNNNQPPEPPINNPPEPVIPPADQADADPPSSTILPTDSVQQQAALPPPAAGPAAPMETDVIVLSDDGEQQAKRTNNTEVKSITAPQNFIPVLYVGTAPCQQFLIAGKNRGDLKCVTVVAAKGTVLGTVNEEQPTAQSPEFRNRILSLKEGKIVVVSGQKSGLKLDVNNATVALPVGSIAVLNKKASGGMSVSMVSGGNAQVSFKGSENQSVMAAPGEEIAFGDSEEELIAADGIDRNVISAKMILTAHVIDDESGSSTAGMTTRSNLRTEKHNLRVEKRKFNRQQMSENESLFVCLDCAQMGCSDGECASTKKNLHRGKAQPINLSKNQEKSPFSPIAYRISLGPAAPTPPTLSTLKVTGGILKHRGASVETSGSIVSVAKGETLLCPQRTTMVKAGEATISADPGSLVLINNRGTSITISNLWENSAGAVKILAHKKTYSPRAGEECILAEGSVKTQEVVLNSPAARRNVHSFSVGTKTMAISEVSLASLFLTSPVLNGLWRSANAEDRAIAEKIAKMYAVLNIVTGRRGPYSYSGR